jgi:hypothetical protein
MHDPSKIGSPCTQGRARRAEREAVAPDSGCSVNHEEETLQYPPPAHIAHSKPVEGVTVPEQVN